MTMTKSAQDFARELTVIVDASANALAALNRVLEQQQRSILALASGGGGPGFNTVDPPGAMSHAVAADTAPPLVTDTAPAAERLPEAASPETPSPEAVLAQAERVARALIEQSPEVAIAHLYQASAHAVGLALLNTVTAQQQLTIVAQAVVTQNAARQLSGSQLPTPPSTGQPAGTAAPAPPRGQARKSRTR